MSNQIPRVLSIAGTDPTGGAGLQADLKSIAAAGGYGMGVVTALVAQNTQRVAAIETPTVTFFEQQLNCILEDVDVEAVKIGMLHISPFIDTVHAFLTKLDPHFVVIDPVMVATSGKRLLEPSAEDSLVELLHKATHITPNIPELEVLTGVKGITDFDSAINAATSLAAENNACVIVKGGHLTGDDAGNTLVRPDGSWFHVPAPRQATKNTHGTGCSLSSALATALCRFDNDERALFWVTDWLNEAIANADGLHVGLGHGPIDHGFQARRFAAAASEMPIAYELINSWDGQDPKTLAAGRTPSPRWRTGPWVEGFLRLVGDRVDQAIMKWPTFEEDRSLVASQVHAMVTVVNAARNELTRRGVPGFSVACPTTTDFSPDKAFSPAVLHARDFLFAEVRSFNNAQAIAAVLPWLTVASFITDTSETEQNQAISAFERELAKACPVTRLHAARVFFRSMLLLQQFTSLGTRLI